MIDGGGEVCNLVCASTSKLVESLRWQVMKNEAFSRALTDKQLEFSRPNLPNPKKTGFGFGGPPDRDGFG